MKYRTLGNTGIQVSEVGFGAWQLGDKAWGGLQGKEAHRLVHKAIDNGCTFFDTAPPYGAGESEVLLGEALEGRRQDVVLVSKFGHNPSGPSDFSVDAIRGSVERSLKTLKTDYLDGLLIHSAPSEILDGHQGHYDILETLKKEGKIRSYGASFDSSAELNTVLKHSNSQISEILFHALDQETSKAFDNAKNKGMGLIVKVPLDSGWLTGKYRADSVFTTGYRDRWSQDVKERRHKLIEELSFLKTEDQTMAQGALRFILSFPEIATIIPGVKTISQLVDNLGASDGRLPDEQVQYIKALWEEKLRDNPLPW